MAPEALVYAQPGQEVAALKRVNDLIGEGMLCEFSVFDGLEETLAYAASGRFPRCLPWARRGKPRSTKSESRRFIWRTGNKGVTI